MGRWAGVLPRRFKEWVGGDSKNSGILTEGTKWQKKGGVPSAKEGNISVLLFFSSSFVSFSLFLLYCVRPRFSLLLNKHHFSSSSPGR